jgi:hypothetical protein
LTHTKRAQLAEFNVEGEMDVSDRQNQVIETNLGGKELLETVVSLTGLPEELMQKELIRILESSGQDSTNLTLDDLRFALLAYLEQLDAGMPEL